MLSVSLTVGERFKDARLVYNKNGKQTLKQVEDETGVTQSLISNLENDEDRKVNYKAIVTLACHYGVSIDWLFGLSEDREPNGTLSQVCEYTGLSSKTASLLYEMAHRKSFNIEDRELIDSFIYYFSRGMFFDIANSYKQAVVASKFEDCLYEKIYNAFSGLSKFRGDTDGATEEAIYALQEFILPRLLDVNFMSTLPANIKPILSMLQFDQSRYELYKKDTPFSPTVMHNVDAKSIALAALNNYLSDWQNRLLCGSADLTAQDICNTPEINTLIETALAEYLREEGVNDG